MSLIRLASLAVTASALSFVEGCLDRPPGTPVQNDPPAGSKEPAPATASPFAANARSDRGDGPTTDESEQARRIVEGAHDEEPKKEDETAGEAVVPQPANGKDPLGGKFGLAEATANLPGNGALIATIKTSKGDIRCTLLEDKAPNTVANFVGLARGLRPYRSHTDGRWVKKPIYDGTTFHRIIKGFMIQGGDPQGTGAGEPGYVINDEIWPGAKHDHAGQLCMANRGKNTNGAQFFITDASVPHLDGNYTIFGECSPASTVRTISSLPKGDADRPNNKVTIEKVEISRGGKGASAAPAAPAAPATKAPPRP